MPQRSHARNGDIAVAYTGWTLTSDPYTWRLSCKITLSDEVPGIG